MTTFPRSPRLVKGGIVLVNADTGIVQRVIALQYNPDTLTRTLQPQAIGEGGNRSEVLRLTGPPNETIRLEAEIDATDHLESANEIAKSHGIHPQLAALEMLIHPSSSQLLANNRLARSGTLEITPMETPLSLFVWSKDRIQPVRLTELSITEEAFDPSLNPIRAKVTLGMRVLNVNDLGFDHRGGNLYMNHLQSKERLASLSLGVALNTLGIGGIT